MRLTFRAIEEAEPGPIWAGLFASLWAPYLRWWSKEGLSARPTYTECRNAFHKHMPEMAPLYEQLCDLVGGGDMQSRFLSFYRPPKYMAGCSQAVWPGEEPLLVRNYDYNANAFDGLVLSTAWGGRRVVGMSDGLFGLIDGMNDAGLCVSLTFGGRREVGDGFGVPIILRYILQTCETTAEAEDALRRIPCHMSYNVTVLDKARKYSTTYLAPDRETKVTRSPVATNHQGRVEWSSHARFTATVERERYLLQRLTLHPETQDRFIGAFLRPPLYSTAFSQGFGTLFTAAYRPRSGEMDLRWPGTIWPHSFKNFAAGERAIMFPG